MAQDQTELECPKCGTMIPVPRSPVRRAEKPIPTPRKARMVWSDKSGRFHRVMMTDPEYGHYRRKGSID